MRLSFRLDLKMLPKKLALVVFASIARDCSRAGTLTKSSFLSTGSRYIYDLYYEKEAISKQLYDWLLKNNYADAMLIAKWKKQGYEKVSAVCAQGKKDMSQDKVADSYLRKTALLLALHPDQGDQLQQHVHLPCTEGAVEAGSGNRVRQLRVQRLFEQ